MHTHTYTHSYNEWNARWVRQLAVQSSWSLMLNLNAITSSNCTKFIKCGKLPLSHCIHNTVLTILNVFYTTKSFHSITARLKAMQIDYWLRLYEATKNAVQHSDSICIRVFFTVNHTFRWDVRLHLPHYWYYWPHTFLFVPQMEKIFVRLQNSYLGTSQIVYLLHNSRVALRRLVCVCAAIRRLPLVVNINRTQ